MSRAATAIVLALSLLAVACGSSKPAPTAPASTEKCGQVLKLGSSGC